MPKKSLWDQYEENEDNNYHSENLVLLAKHFGSEEDLADAEMVREKIKKGGGHSDGSYEVSVRLNKKLYPILVGHHAANAKKMEHGGSVSKGDYKIGIWYVTAVNANGPVKSILQSQSAAEKFLKTALKYQGAIHYKLVREGDYNAGRVTVATIKNYKLPEGLAHGGAVGVKETSDIKYLEAQIENIYSPEGKQIHYNDIKLMMKMSDVAKGEHGNTTEKTDRAVKTLRANGWIVVSGHVFSKGGNIPDSDDSFNYTIGGL